MLPFILLSIGSFVAWAAWIFVLFHFDPFVGGWVVHVLFYFSAGVALFGTCLLLGILLHHLRTRLAASSAEMFTIAREAILIAAFVIIILNLAAHRLLKWWNILPLALLVLTAELFFISLNKRPHRKMKCMPDESQSAAALEK